MGMIFAFFATVDALSLSGNPACPLSLPSLHAPTDIFLSRLTRTYDCRHTTSRRHYEPMQLASRERAYGLATERVNQRRDYHHASVFDMQSLSV